MAQESKPAPTLTEEAPETPEKPLDISGLVATGLRWKALTQVVSEGSRVVVTLVLARLLTPGDYGVAGMAIVCVSFAGLFTDPALGTALVQRRNITEADRSTVFWTTVVVGAVVSLIGVGVSGYVADLFGQHEVKKLFMVLSAGLFISGLSVTQMALLTRELAYRSIEIREIFATLVAAASALAVAIAGFGPWAIITNWLVFVSVSTVLVWYLTPWRPRFTYSRKSLDELGSFGFRIFGARILSWGNGNMDNVLIGRYLGAPALGAYALAYNVMYVPMTRISVPLSSVLSPAYARMQDDPERLRLAWLKGKRVMTALLAPAFLACIVVAPELVRVAFGAKWHNAVIPLQLLSFAGLAQSLVTLHWSVLTATGKASTLLRLNLFVTVLTIGAFIAGLPFGIIGVAAFYAGAKWALVMIDTWYTTRAVSYPFWSSLRSGTVLLPVAGTMAAIGLGVRLLLVHDGVAPIVRLLVVSVVMLAAYVGLIRLLLPELLGEMKGVLARNKKS